MEREVIELDNTQLEVGMELADSLYNAQGMLILTKGTILSEKTISGLVLMDIKNISVWQEIQPSAEEDFLLFQNTYEKTSSLILTLWDEVKQSKKVDQKKILFMTEEIFEKFVDHEAVLKYMNELQQNEEASYNHSLNVALIAHLFIDWLKLPEEMGKELIFTALVHDIGKLFLPPERMAEHATIGARFLAQQGASRAVQQGIQMHHTHEQGEETSVHAEWWSIHPFAKIISIADFYDHLTNPEGALQQKICPFQFICTLGNSYYGKFDIRYIEMFLSKIANCYMGRTVLLSDNREATIVFINHNALAQPIVKIQDTLVDLYLEKHLHIVEVLN